MTMERFALPPELEEFRAVVRRFCEEVVSPRAAEMDEKDEWPEDLYRAMVQQGLMGVGYPESVGGSGGGALGFGLLIEEISRVSAGLSLTPLVAKLGVIPMEVAGDTDKAERMSAAIVSGDILMSYALTEPSAGSDAAAMRTRYVRDGDSFVLNGTKRFISGAGVSQAYVVFATSDPEKGTSGISAFLVMEDDPGFAVGRKEDKMGVRGSPTGELLLTGCRIPVDRLIGEEGRGFAYAMATLDRSRPTVGAQAVGIAQGAFDFAAGYALEREQFGRPISELEAIRTMLADMAMKIEASRMLVYRALEACDTGDPRVTYHSAVAKCFAGDAAMSVTTDAVQILGGYGYVRDYPVERFMRDAKITQIYEGTNQIQRVVIARQIFKALGAH